MNSWELTKKKTNKKKKLERVNKEEESGGMQDLSAVACELLVVKSRVLQLRPGKDK